MMNGRVGFAVAISALLAVTVFAKDASTQTQEKATMMDAFKNMEPLDWIRSGTLLIGCLAAILHGRRTFLVSLLLGTSFFALGDYFFPSQPLDYAAKTKVDVVHHVLVQTIGAMRLGTAAAFYSIWDSRDVAVSSSMMLSQGIGAMVMSISIVMDYNKWQSRFEPQMITFILLSFALCALGCLVHTFKGSSFGKGNFDMRSRTSRHLLVHSIIFICAGLFYFGYPDSQLNTIIMKDFRADGVHYHLGRVVGIVALMEGLLCLLGLGFQYEADQRALILGSLVSFAALLPMQALYQWKYKLVEFSGCAGVLALNCCVLGNLLCGYFNFQGFKLKRS